jgi:hypothetical protein
MRELTRALALISVLSFACREAQNPVAPASPAESPDYAVYDAVLDGLFQSDAGAAAPAGGIWRRTCSRYCARSASTGSTSPARREGT